jgi:hypothetical protein
MTVWARKAARLVFQQAEDLHEDNIVTLMIVCLFWYTQGSWRLSQFQKGSTGTAAVCEETYFSTGVAAQTLHVIGLGTARTRGNNTFEAEIKRRRLWACYLMQCQSGDNLTFFESIADLPTLSLPWSESDFDAGVSRRASECLKTTTSERTVSGSLYAEVIRGLTLW